MSNRDPAGTRKEEVTTLKASLSKDFATMLSALTRHAAFPCVLSDEEIIPVIQTHASAVLLTPEHAYKLKKPKSLGFLDFSTPELRRHFCMQEVLVNRRLAPHVYLGVAPVLEYPNGQLLFGPTFAADGLMSHPDSLPMPGSMFDGGCVIDFAVVMVRLPDEAMLEFKVRTGTADAMMLAQIAQCVAAFHASTHTDEHVAHFGQLDVIRGNWEENFEQMKPYIGRTLDVATYECIAGYIHNFMQERSGLFASRVSDRHIRDCHGDLRLQHIYLLDKAVDPTRRLAIIDGIEFNERFRYSDVASEVAFLTMELDTACRPDLSRAFVERYVAETGDDVLRELLPFYACYRACVRAKVTSFQLDEPEVPETQHESARQLATLLFAQAASYASGPTRATLLVVGGLMGTGKSTLAQAIHHESGWALFSSDIIRKQLAHLDPARPQADDFGQGLYSAVWTARTYQALLSEAGAALASGRSVVLDASFLHQADRQAAADLAAAHGARAFFIECTCPREVALKRLAQRWKLRIEGSSVPDDEAWRASDGRPDLYEAQDAVWEPFVAGLEPYTEYITVTTTLPLVVNVEQALEALQLPRFACWL
jgi:aminoglycoside phosphotransferase family enzyme/predicted kinase